MAPPLLFDISHIDFDKPPQYDTAAVERVNPHREAMRMIDGVFWMDEACTRAVAYRDVKGDEFWVPGHIPGRPIFPGVLMIESAAQLASFVTLSKLKNQPFMGFAGATDIKFRGQVVPGDRFIILGLETNFRPRRIVCNLQGFVRGTLVFEATIVGMPM